VHLERQKRSAPSDFFNATNKELSELIHENFLENSGPGGKFPPAPGDFSPPGFWAGPSRTADVGSKGWEMPTAGIEGLQLPADTSFPIRATVQKVVEFAKKKAIPGGGWPRRLPGFPIYCVGPPPRSAFTPPSVFAPASFFPFFSTVPFFAM